REEDKQARSQNEPGGNIKKALTIAHQATPARVRGLDAKAKVAHDRFEDDIAANKQGGIHYDWPGGIGQYVAEHHTQVACPNSASRQHELTLLQCQKLPTHKARRVGPGQDSYQDNHTFRSVVGERSRQDEKEEVEWHCQDDIRETHQNI